MGIPKAFGAFKKDTNLHQFHWQQVAIALLKDKEIHEGLWRIGVAFSEIMGANVNTPSGQRPAALVAIDNVCLTRVEQMGELVVDAAVMNPRQRLILTGHN